MSRVHLVFVAIMAPGRTSEVAVADSTMAHILDDCLLHGSSLESMARYSKVNFRLRQDWPGLFANRQLLHDLLSSTNGRVVQQVSFVRQVDAWRISQPTVSGNFSDAEKLCYRIRCMMAHIVAAKKGGRRPPHRYAKLSGVLDCVPADAPVPAIADDMPLDEDDEISVASPVLEDGEVQQEQLPDRPIVLCSSQSECEIVPSPAVDLSDLERELFTPAKKSRAAGETPPKLACAHLSDDQVALPFD